MEEYKGYRIASTPDLVAYQVEYVGRGSQPFSLRGYFTDKRTAKRFIDVYLDGKEVDNGKDDSSGRSQQVQRRTRNRR